MAIKNSVRAEILTSFSSADLTGVFQAINPLGLSRPCGLIRLVNDTDVDVVVSYNGIDENDYLQTGKVLEVNIRTSSDYNHLAQFSKGTVVYVSGGAGQSGNLYLTAYSQEE